MLFNIGFITLYDFVFVCDSLVLNSFNCQPGKVKLVVNSTGLLLTVNNYLFESLPSY